MSKMSFAFQEEHNERGFIITTGSDGFEFLFPRLSKSKEYGQIAPEHCLFIFVHDLLYKFQCEDIDTSNFYRTGKFLSAYHVIYNMKETPFFKNSYEKMAIHNKSEFMNAFYYSVIQELEKYHGFLTQKLVEEAKKELLKIKDVL